MIFFGALLIYGGWTNRSVWALARGDDSQPKPTIAAGQTGIRAATSG
jgi:hypothetical protein